MGVEIAYEVSLPAGSDLDSIFRMLKESIERKGFKTGTAAVKGPGSTYISDSHAQARFEIIQRGTATDCLESHRGEWPSEIRGLWFSLHPNATMMEITLGRYQSGWFGFGGIKTQTAPPQAHKDAVAVLDRLKELGATLKVHDDTTYFDTRDDRRLLSARDLTNAISAQGRSITRAGGAATEVRVGRQTLTYEAEFIMAQFRWGVNEGKISQVVFLGAPAPWEREASFEEAYLQSLRSQGFMWYQLPADGRLPTDLFARIYDVDPKYQTLGDLALYCLDLQVNAAGAAGRVLPVLVAESKGVRNRKIIPYQGRTDLDEAALQKEVLGLGPEVDRYATSFDAYLTVGGVRYDLISVQAGEREVRWGLGVGQRYSPKTESQQFRTVGQPIILGPTKNDLRQDPERISCNSPCVQSEETAFARAPAPPQVMVVDEEHSSMYKSKDPPPYVIKNTDRLTLDFADHVFDTSKNIGKPVNAIHVFLGEKSAYFAEINPGEKRVELNGDNLQRLRGGIFRGFREHGLVWVGWQNRDDVTRKIEFAPFWVARFLIEGAGGPAVPPIEPKEENRQDWEPIPEAPEISESEMRKLNVYFARGTRNQDITKKMHEAMLERSKKEDQQEPPGQVQDIEVVPEDSGEEGQPGFYQTEALQWLAGNKNKAALASERFRTTQEAVDAVKRLYEAGAVRVEVVVTYNEPSRIERDGGSYADELEVTFPTEGKERLLAVIKSLEPDNWRMGGLRLDKATVESVGPEPETLWWAGV